MNPERCAWRNCILMHNELFCTLQNLWASHKVRKHHIELFLFEYEVQVMHVPSMSTGKLNKICTFYVFFSRIFDTKNNNTFFMIYLLYMYFTLPLYIILFISSWCSAWNGPWFAEEWERVWQEAEEHTGHLCWAPEVSHGWCLGLGAIN